ncbi:hypothetical protein PGT21_016138 [Puccinia graminis f. sp. tritici]|uniref:Uncharacterized protein n=1 Tax=Puccinia graminis f. sp. tritici TaxID=56615 RepID=A0A5B0PY74_PUCGR|nr:hypothetical protein PGT21_016138 [Puccinia graminis f. sp. tritici]
MDAYATTILDTQDSVLQQNIHPQRRRDTFLAGGTTSSLNNNLSANRCGIYLFIDEVPSSEDDDPLQRAELLIISLGEEDPFGQAGTSCMLAEVYPLHRAMSVEYRPDTGLVRRGRHILAEQAQAIPLPARSDCRRDSK